MPHPDLILDPTSHPDPTSNGSSVIPLSAVPLFLRRSITSQRGAKKAPTISRKPVGVGATCQRLIPTGEQSGLQTHIAVTESGSLGTPMKSWLRFGNWNRRLAACRRAICDGLELQLKGVKRHMKQHEVTVPQIGLIAGTRANARRWHRAVAF